MVLLKIATPLVLAMIWGYAAFTIYRIPAFPDNVAGIYVARFANDRGGVVQNRIVDVVKKTLAAKQLPTTIDVKPLARSIGDQDAELARSLGKQGRAAMVLWGEVDESNKSTLVSEMVVVNAHGVYRGPALGIYTGSATDVRRFGLPDDVERLGKSVALFLGGYIHYHSQQYASSLSYFRAAQQELGEPSQERAASPEKLMLGAIHFYLANALLLSEQSLSGERAQEIQNHYEQAVTLTSHPVEAEGKPQYLEPLNNLGFFLIFTNRFDEASKVLEQAETICQRENANQPGLCATVRYNFGGARMGQMQYEEAARLFNETIQKLQSLRNAERDSEYLLLLPRAHHATAAAYVRFADKAPPENQESLLQKAQAELEKARESISTAESDREALLNKINLTQARLLLARKDWARALEILKSIDLKDDPDLHLLLSIAYSCNNDEERGGVNLALFLLDYADRRQDPKFIDDREYNKRLTAQCLPQE